MDSCTLLMKPPRLVVSVSSLQLAARIKSVLKRIWFALLLPAFMAGNAIAASVAIPNGNFEGLTGTLPTSWTTPYGNGFEYSSTLRVHGGSRSLKIVDTSGSAPGAMRSASIPVIESRLYTAKVWANVDTSNSGPVSLYLEFWNAQGTKMLDYQVDATLALDTWVQLTVADKYAPYGATHCTLMVYSTAPYVGQMFFDDATLEIKDISFATAGVVVADPSFEGGSGSSLPPDWTDYTANGFEAGSTALVNSGSRSVYISDNSASLSGGILSK